MDNAKPFCIPKRWVWKAYKRVKANRGAAGVDEQSVEQFEEHLKGNPIIRGWLTYYGRYYPSGLYPTLQYLDRRLARWAEGKYKRLRRHRRRSEHRIRAIAACDPGLFAHWCLLHRAAAGR